MPNYAGAGLLLTLTLSLPWETTSWFVKENGTVSALGSHKLVCEGKWDCQGEARLWTRTKEALVCERLEISHLLSLPHCHQVFSVLSFVQMFSTLICFPICPNLSPPECFICQLRNEICWEMLRGNCHFPSCVSVSYYQHFQLANIAIDNYSSSQPDRHSLECTY